MNARLFITTVILYSSQVFAYEYPIDTWQWENEPKCGLYFNEKVEETIKKRWDGSGEPPVNISNIQLIINKWATQKFGNNSKYHITNYELTSFRGEDMESNHWIYIISFLKFDGGKLHGIDKVAILMDGTIIEKICK